MLHSNFSHRDLAWRGISDTYKGSAGMLMLNTALYNSKTFDNENDWRQETLYLYNDF